MTRNELKSAARSNPFTHLLAADLAKYITFAVCSESKAPLDEVRLTILPQARKKAEDLAYELADFINLTAINEVYTIKNKKRQ